MALTDYQELLHRLQKAVGETFMDSPALFNLPGSSIALKLDTNYFLALAPGFVNFLARKAGLFPSRVQETLIKTGSMISQPPERDPVVQVVAVHRGKRFNLNACFVLADFIDRSIQLHGRASIPLELSDVKLHPQSKPALEPLFKNKTPLHHIAFSE
jgi:hypothetical protein